MDCKCYLVLQCMAVELPEQELKVLLNCGTESETETWNCGMNFSPRVFLQPGAIEGHGGCPCPHLIGVLGHLLGIPGESPGFTPSHFAAAFSSQQWKWKFVLEPHTVGKFHAIKEVSIRAEPGFSFIPLFGPGCRTMTFDKILGLRRPGLINKYKCNTSFH